MPLPRSAATFQYQSPAVSALGTTSEVDLVRISVAPTKSLSRVDGHGVGDGTRHRLPRQERRVVGLLQGRAGGRREERGTGDVGGRQRAQRVGRGLAGRADRAHLPGA